MFRLFRPFLFSVIVFLFSSLCFVRAAGEYDKYCGLSYEVAVNSGEPGPTHVLCAFVRVFNLLLLMLGVVLVILIIYGAIKLNMSLGDPKGLAGAQQHWTWLVVGTFVVAGFFTIYFIASKIIGVTPFESPTAILDNIFLKLDALLKSAGILH